jgi:prepilin-type N-terminal cleavage/methylation domain-containing protein
MINSRKNGFSLIELSIAFIIMGLLITGVVGGNAMVKATKNQKIAREFGNVELGIRSYMIRSNNNLPGDLDGNHKIEFVNKTGQNEANEAWKILIDGGYIAMKTIDIEVEESSGTTTTP